MRLTSVTFASPGRSEEPLGLLSPWFHLHRPCAPINIRLSHLAEVPAVSLPAAACCHGLGICTAMRCMHRAPSAVLACIRRCGVTSPDQQPHLRHAGPQTGGAHPAGPHAHCQLPPCLQPSHSLPAAWLAPANQTWGSQRIGACALTDRCCGVTAHPVLLSTYHALAAPWVKTALITAMSSCWLALSCYHASHRTH